MTHEQRSFPSIDDWLMTKELEGRSRRTCAFYRFADMVVQQNNRRDRSNDVQIYLGQDGIYHASPNCGRKVVDDG